MSWIVESQGWYLRGTTWAGTEDRATKYETPAKAQEALNAARKYMKPAAFKAAHICEATA